jgi:hypothetical protein
MRKPRQFEERYQEEACRRRRKPKVIAWTTTYAEIDFYPLAALTGSIRKSASRIVPLD